MNVIVVFGLPGSGKSYFAERLSEALGAVYLSTDQIRNKYNMRRDYSFMNKMRVYDKIIELGDVAFHTNDTVVLDGTFYLESIREKVLCHFRKMGAHVLFVEIKADPSVIKKRLEKHRIFSDADYEVYQKISKSFERMCMPHFVLHSTNDNIDEMIRLGLKYFENSMSYVPIGA